MPGVSARKLPKVGKRRLLRRAHLFISSADLRVLSKRQRVVLIEETHDFAEELHAILLQHHRVGAFADFDQPLVGDVYQLGEILGRLVGRQNRNPTRRE